jgi:LuxR family quorum-sensing transcriptional regulator LasR
VRFYALTDHPGLPDVNSPDMDKPTKLSARQQEVLKWTALGKTSWETSIIMNCSVMTVNYHLRQVFRKLSATNKAHAVSIAMSLGLLADELQSS